MSVGVITASGLPRGTSLVSVLPLRDALLGELAWRRTSWMSRQLELCAGSSVVARLSYEGMLRARGVGESADGVWTFQREGFLRSPFVVRDATRGEPIARFERGWIGRGTLRFESGATYQWSSRGAFLPTWFWATESGDDLIRYHRRISWMSRLEMEVEPTALVLPELPVLVLAGAHIMAMRRRARAHWRGRGPSRGDGRAAARFERVRGQFDRAGRLDFMLPRS